MRLTKRQLHQVCGCIAATLTGIQFSAGTVLQIIAMHDEGGHNASSISIPFLGLGLAATLAWVTWGASGEKPLWVAIIPNGLGVASYAVLAALVLISNSAPSRPRQPNNALIIALDEALTAYENEKSPQ